MFNSLKEIEKELLLLKTHVVDVKHIENMLGFITSFIVTVVLGLTLLTVIDLIK